MAGLTVPLTGCLNGLTGSGQDVGLVLRNYTAEPQPLQVELLREDGADQAEAEVLRREFEVPPPTESESAGTVRKPAIAPLQRYLVRARLKFGAGGWDHHHFIPDSSGAAEIDVRVYRNEATGELETQFG